MNEYTDLYSTNYTESSELLAGQRDDFLSLFVNVSTDTVEVLSLTGRLFHIAGPDIVKSCCPIVVLICRMTSMVKKQEFGHL